MQDQFFLFYLSVIISCLIAAVIMPRIWPLNKIPDEYAKDVSSDARTEQLPESKTAIGHITNHISTTVFNPDLKKSFTPGALIPTSVAISNP
jgi:nucleoside recognition membrane protein YjiH